MQTEKDRILELRKALEYHNYKYYIENAPEISDREFDGLMHDLEKLEEKYPEMYDPNSPTPVSYTHLSGTRGRTWDLCRLIERRILL